MTDRYRTLTTLAVLLVATIAAVVSYMHVASLALRYGQPPVAAYLLPVSIDGLVLVALLVMLRSARLGVGAPWLARSGRARRRGDAGLQRGVRAAARLARCAPKRVARDRVRGRRGDGDRDDPEAAEGGNRGRNVPVPGVHPPGVPGAHPSPTPTRLPSS